MPAFEWKPIVHALPYVLRLLAVLVSFALSWYGVLWGYAGAVGLAQQAMGQGTEDTLPWMLVVALLLAYAWIAWLTLGLAWVAQRRLHPWWPISGTVVGIVCILFTFGFAIVFTFPAITMAIVFVAFHLSDEARRIEAAR